MKMIGRRPFISIDDEEKLESENICVIASLLFHIGTRLTG